MLPVFETKRLKLRPPHREDLQDIYRLGSSPAVMRYISKGKTQTLKEAEADLERRIKTSTDIFGYWIAEVKESSDFIGWFALKKLDKTDEIELGYRFLEEYWGRGLATEGGQKLLEYAFQTLNLPRVVAIAIEENKASTRVMEKLGMHYVKEGNFYGFHCVYYQISQQEFLEKMTI